MTLLERCGYYRLCHIRDERGRIVGTEAFVYETPELGDTHLAELHAAGARRGRRGALYVTCPGSNSSQTLRDTPLAPPAVTSAVTSALHRRYIGVTRNDARSNARSNAQSYDLRPLSSVTTMSNDGTTIRFSNHGTSENGATATGAAAIGPADATDDRGVPIPKCGAAARAPASQSPQSASSDAEDAADAGGGEEADWSERPRAWDGNEGVWAQQLTSPAQIPLDRYLRVLFDLDACDEIEKSDPEGEVPAVLQAFYGVAGVMLVESGKAWGPVRVLADAPHGFDFAYRLRSLGVRDVCGEEVCEYRGAQVVGRVIAVRVWRVDDDEERERLFQAEVARLHHEGIPPSRTWHRGAPRRPLPGMAARRTKSPQHGRRD